MSAMATRERPIIFAAESVRAIVRGDKTQTRRAIAATLVNDRDMADPLQRMALVTRCPYGQKGDHLWVRETWRQGHEYMGEPPIVYRATAIEDGASDDPDDVWQSPISMPRRLSRLTLQITKVRSERLHDISDEDAIAEGYAVVNPDVWYLRTEEGERAQRVYHLTGARAAFAAAWDMLNAKRGYGWPVNPWVWVITFGAAR